MEELKEIVKDFSNEQLIDQYANHRDEYTPEALDVIEKEIDLRRIDKNAAVKKCAPVEKMGRLSLDSDDFVLFEHTFNRTDLLMAVSILRENEVLFFADNPSPVDFFPVESEAAKRFSIHVHKEHEKKAHELLDEHFEKAGAEYLCRYSQPRERLKSFNFHDIRLSEKEAKETIDVGFSEDEIEVITRYGKRLLTEVDIIEQNQQRVVFFLDSIEPILDSLKSPKPKLTASDLLAILEILQIYCDDPSFPDSMDEPILTLLNFFDL